MKQNSCEHEDEEQFVKTLAVIGEECINVV